jgi:hypothetical protein
MAILMASVLKEEPSVVFASEATLHLRIGGKEPFAGYFSTGGTSGVSMARWFFGDDPRFRDKTPNRIKR